MQQCGTLDIGTMPRCPPLCGQAIFRKDYTLLFRLASQGELILGKRWVVTRECRRNFHRTGAVLDLAQHKYTLKQV